MLTGAGQRKSSYASPITGLGAVKIVGVNPTNEQYKTITGKDMPYTLEYNKRENTYANNREEFPVRILVHCEEKNVYDFVNFSFSNQDDIAATGSVRFVDSKGNMTYSKDLETIKANEKMSWFDADNARPLTTGEYNLFTFIKMLTSYDSRAEGANFLGEMEKAGITGKLLFNGNISGLVKLFDWANKQNFAVTVLFAVEEKTSEKGTLENQKIISNPDLFFYTDADKTNPAKRVVSNYAYKSMEKLIKGDDSKNQKPLTIKGYATYKLQDYKKEDCFNVEPDASAPAISAAPSARWG